MNRAARLYGHDRFNTGVEVEVAHLVDGKRPQLVACDGRLFVLDAITRDAPYAVYQEASPIPATEK